MRPEFKKASRSLSACLPIRDVPSTLPSRAFRTISIKTLGRCRSNSISAIRTPRSRPVHLQMWNGPSIGPYPTLFVPSSAVTTDLQRTFVIRVRQGKAEWVDVKTGVTVNGKTEVFGDLQPGDVVVPTPQIRFETEPVYRRRRNRISR